MPKLDFAETTQLCADSSSLPETTAPLLGVAQDTLTVGRSIPVLTRLNRWCLGWCLSRGWSTWARLTWCSLQWGLAPLGDPPTAQPAAARPKTSATRMSASRALRITAPYFGRDGGSRHVSDRTWTDGL